MKRKILFITLILGILLFYSCSKKDEEAKTPQDGDFQDFVYDETGGISNPGFSLLVNAGFYTLAGTDDGEETTKMKWAASLSLGEKVMTGSTRRLTLDSNSRVYNVIEVRRDNGTVGFALASQIASNGRLAVVVDERATLFRTPRNVDVTGTILSQKTVLVYFPETERDGFVEVRGYDRGRDRYIDENVCNVRLTSLSRMESDIQAAILMQTALLLSEDQTVRRTALLESALNDFPDSVFYSEIYKLVHPGTAAESSDSDDWWY